MQELQALSGRMTTIEDRVNQQNQVPASPSRSQTSTTTSEPESDLMLPTLKELPHTHVFHQTVRKITVGIAPPPVNSTKRAVALTKLIMSLMATFTCMCVPITLPREKTITTQLRIAGMLHQKTNEALQ